MSLPNILLLIGKSLKKHIKGMLNKKKLNLDITGDKNWVMVRPEDIGIKPKGSFQ